MTNNPTTPQAPSCVSRLSSLVVNHGSGGLLLRPAVRRQTPNTGCQTPDARRQTQNGFTLIELIVVIAIIGILAVVALPAMKQAPKRAREAALKENLFTIRSCIDQFYADFQKYPGSLDELVSKGYLRKVPVDPVTGQANWVTEEGELPESDFGDFSDLAEPGIVDVRSASSDSSIDGTPYSEW